MRKPHLIIGLVSLCILLSSCGQVSNTVTRHRASAPDNASRQLTAEEIALEEFISAVSDLAMSMKAPLKSESAAVAKGFSAMSVALDNGGDLVTANHFTRQVNGTTETVDIRSVFYWNGQPIANYTAGTSFNLVERIVSIDSPKYAYTYPEKIEYHNGLITISKLNGYSATMTHKTQGINVVILSRDLTYDKNGNSTGTMSIESNYRNSLLAGTLNIANTNGFSANGDLYIGAKKAVNVEIDNSDTVTITNLFGPDNNYYYNSGNLPPAANSELTLNLAPNTTYGDIILSSGATAYANKLAIINGDKTATINGTITITAYNAHLGIFLQDLIFNVPADKTAITTLSTTPLSIKNCTFIQDGAGVANPVLLEIKKTSTNQVATVRGTEIENCTFLGSSAQNATGIYLSEKGNPRLTVSNCLFSNLAYGVYSVSKLPTFTGTNDYVNCSNQHN